GIVDHSELRQHSLEARSARKTTAEVVGITSIRRERGNALVRIIGAGSDYNDPNTRESLDSSRTPPVKGTPIPAEGIEETHVVNEYTEIPEQLLPVFVNSLVTEDCPCWIRLGCQFSNVSLRAIGLLSWGETIFFRDTDSTFRDFAKALGCSSYRCLLLLMNLAFLATATHLFSKRLAGGQFSAGALAWLRNSEYGSLPSECVQALLTDVVVAAGAVAVLLTSGIPFCEGRGRSLEIIDAGLKK
ncbi:unnamed protein product, partial [Polarella glacialis]